MKRLNRIGVWSLLLLSLASCQEAPLPEVKIGATVFSFEGTFDGQAVSLVAGEAGVYQEIGLSQTEDGLYEFSGTLGQKECVDCPEQLSVTLRDIELSDPDGLLPIDRAPQSGTYDYFYKSAKEESVEVAFELDEGLSPAQLSWDFGDGGTANIFAPTHTYIDTVLETATVCLQTSDGSGCVTSICNVIDLKDTACRAAFQYEIDPSVQFVTFRDKSVGSRPLKYRWTFGDGYSATLGNPGYYYSQSGRYDACLEIEDDNGCVSQICKEISPDLSTCTAGYSYRVTRIESGTPLQEGTVSCSWVDEDRVRFHSASTAQTETSSFMITAAERYPEDQDGMAAWKISFTMRKELSDADGNPKTLEGSGVMAIGFPAE